MKWTVLHGKQVPQVGCVCICHVMCKPKIKTLVLLQTDSLNDHFRPEKKKHFHTYFPSHLCEQPALF